MNEDDQEAWLQACFAQAETELPAQDFAETVMRRVEQHKRRKLYRRLVLGLALALLLPPLRDLGLVLTQVLMVTIVELDNALVGQLLAPINSVGGLLSLVLLGLKLMHMRWFR
ncbi:MAG: hypothetical protein ACR2PZ_17690 [Pseudomonadales bacterium]